MKPSRVDIAIAALQEIMRKDGPGLDLSPAGPCYNIAKKALQAISKRCDDCDRRARYAAVDPERYRGEDTCCDACQKKAKPRLKVKKIGSFTFYWDEKRYAYLCEDCGAERGQGHDARGHM